MPLLEQIAVRLAAGWYLVVPPAVHDQPPGSPPTSKVTVNVEAPLKDWWRLPPNAARLYDTPGDCEAARKALVNRPPPTDTTQEVVVVLGIQRLHVRCVADDDPALK